MLKFLFLLGTENTVGGSWSLAVYDILFFRPPVTSQFIKTIIWTPYSSKDSPLVLITATREGVSEYMFGRVYFLKLCYFVTSYSCIGFCSDSNIQDAWMEYNGTHVF